MGVVERIVMQCEEMRKRGHAMVHEAKLKSDVLFEEANRLERLASDFKREQERAIAQQEPSK